MSLVRAVPFIAKPWVFNEGRWRFAGLAGSGAGAVDSVAEHSAFLRWLPQNIHVDDGRPTARFLHSVASHAPVIFDRDCNRIEPQSGSFEHSQGHVSCALSGVADLLDSMRSAGAFERSTIVILSDHGSGYATIFPRSSDRSAPPQPMTVSRMGTANAFIMTRAAGGSDAPLVLNDQPRSLSETGRIVCELSGACVADTAPQDRRFSWYNWQDVRRHIQQVPMSTFHVDGPVHDPASWELIEE